MPVTQAAGRNDPESCKPLSIQGSCEAVRHKLRIFKGRYLALWYVECQCGWEPEESSPSGFLGRAHHDAALAVGIAHQIEEKDGCDCE